jgi:hypothetical protein
MAFSGVMVCGCGELMNHEPEARSWQKASNFIAWFWYKLIWT